MNIKLSSIRLTIGLISLTLFVNCQKDDDLPVNSNLIFEGLDSVVKNQMVSYNIPGASIAVIRNEKLVYTNSFGYSNKIINKIATNDDLYRIASISKPITAIAILKLVEDGLLSLDQKVFGPDGILGDEYGTLPANSNKKLITVSQLLNHESGWTNSPNDPVFSDFNKSLDDLITDMVLHRKLVNPPGSVYYYLNFGYTILGRIIEKITKVPYEVYVKSNILEPCGISKMKIGRNTLADKYPNEVTYYQGSNSTSNSNPYDYNIVRMDSPAGWIASATDLARFIVKIDRNPSKPDIISNILLNNSFFASSSWYHTGSMSGTSGIINKLDDTLSYVVLFNKRADHHPDIVEDEFRKAFDKEILTISKWPNDDLF
ncbi:beta-lactamase [Aquimarina sp. MAR_2010_214]|uniref:serine hydrolase domain-containing protein n=1 Tax=Aquimarina sp. MAR_2010_214 TaxID=1250026 RepID=UPI000C704F6A|nr:serine hydrolase domain-containing protein [Aquimarina sp. MAR_2010_214]PKV49927.1 beta-lactamase [Aquimarina sp. MAR_2010_214]